ncbi:uncharacterized protein LTR77_000289 [Saxophila tyrrhenica]|uniref:Uncharacterized protein n=1 Tax=Saxophila tyrrhenica TaxID=1690608 RepID=A0AAV9PQR0_9PEZI|nr:hypothetical protein LTR77_000289 [Saxophila tyrrhenica]
MEQQTSTPTTSPPPPYVRAPSVGPTTEPSVLNPKDTADQPAGNLSIQPPPLLDPSIDRKGQEEVAPLPTQRTWNPKRLVGLLVPFPQPNFPLASGKPIPTKYFLYVPPPPPLEVPKEGEKESRGHKAQRKWEAKIRKAKTSEPEMMS